MTLLLDIQGKSYLNGGKRRAVLAPLRLELAQGEFVCLLGPSGCGKTTLLNIIAGLRTADGGHATQRPRDLAYVFQEPRLMPWLTVLDNILLVTDGGAQARARAKALLQRVRLDDAQHVYPNALSGGMRRRVALVRAFVTQPQFLLMDEPFVSLDEALAANLRQLLLDLWKSERPTILFVTHNADEALMLGGRLLYLKGTPAKITLDLAIDVPRHRRDEAFLKRLRRRLPRGDGELYDAP